MTAWLAPARVLPRRGVGGEGGAGAKTKAAESEEVQIDASFQMKGVSGTFRREGAKL